MFDALVMAGALRVAVLDLSIDAGGWYVARQVAGTVEVVDRYRSRKSRYIGGGATE